MKQVSKKSVTSPPALGRATAGSTTVSAFFITVGMADTTIGTTLRRYGTERTRTGVPRVRRRYETLRSTVLVRGEAVLLTVSVPRTVRALDKDDTIAGIVGGMLAPMTESVVGNFGHLVDL